MRDLTSSIKDSQIGGRGAVAFVAFNTFRGNVSITNSTFSNLHPILQSTTAKYQGGAIYFNEADGKIDIKDNYFDNVGVEDNATQLAYREAMQGGAIYIGDTTNVNLETDGTVNPITIENNIFNRGCG